MRNRQTIVILVASAFVLFIGLVSLSSATINVGDDFDFQSVYRFLNASTSSVLGGLSVGTSTAQTPGAIYSTGNITSLGSFIGSLSAVNVSSGIFGSTAGKGNYTFQAAANTNPVLFVDATNERVGIGTTSPGAKLEVNGTTKFADGTTWNDGTLRATLTWGGAGTMFYGASGQKLNLGANGATSNIVINTNGNVGIATTTPQGTLDVVGTLFSTNRSNSNNRHIILSGSSGNTWDIYGGHGGGGYFGIAENQGTPFFTVLASSGNVGIATTTPASPLTVVGTIQSASGGFKFPDGTTQTTAATGVPAGTVIFYDGSSCPSGWTEFTSARGRVVVGLPSGGTLDGTVGTALTDLQIPTHRHDLPFHVNPSNPYFTYEISPAPPTGSSALANRWTPTTQGQYAYDTRARVSTLDNTSTIPYIQLLVCKKS
jgi:hypothetical protein